MDETATVSETAAPGITGGEQAAHSLQLLTVPEVAGILKVSPAKVWQLIARGRLDSLKIDTSRRIPGTEVDRFIRERMAEAGRADAQARQAAAEVL